MAPAEEVPALAVLRAVALTALDALGRLEFDRVVEQSTQVREIDGQVKRVVEGGVACNTRIGECFVPCNADAAPEIKASLMLSVLPCAAGPYAGWAVRYVRNEDGWVVKSSRPRQPGGGAGGSFSGGPGSGSGGGCVRSGQRSEASGWRAEPRRAPT